jgi:hypothetical protein
MPYARYSDPSTSHAAAQSVQNISPTKQVILELLVEPMNDEELVVAYDNRVHEGTAPMASPSGVRSRRAELVKDEYIADTCVRSKLSTGRSATVWKTTGAGIQRGEQLW